MKIEHSKYLLILYFLIFLVQNTYSQESINNIQEDFLHLPEDTRPGCFWFWMNDNISKKGISKDLKAMSKIGLGRAYIAHIFDQRKGDDTPAGDVKFMSPEWWKALRWAVKEASRYGIEIGFFNSPGWSQSGGAWIKPEQSMRYITYSETLINGGHLINKIIPIPEITTFPESGGANLQRTGLNFTKNEFQDVRLIAFKRPESESREINYDEIKYHSDDIFSLGNLFDSSFESYSLFDVNKTIVIDLDLSADNLYSRVNSIVIKPLDYGFLMNCDVETSSDERNYHYLTSYTEERGHLGPLNLKEILVPIPTAIKKYIRLKFSFYPLYKTVNPIRIAEISVSGKEVVSDYVRKQLGETSESSLPKWDTYVWKDQLSPASYTFIKSKEVVDLTSKMDREGRLIWNAPKGEWIVLRMGMLPIGMQCHPASEESRGLEIDKMNKVYVKNIFDGMVGEFLKRTKEKERTALKYIIADSYETGPQNWTDSLIEKFTLKFGYSPKRYLPILTGRIVDNVNISNRFLWDLRKFISDEIAYEFVGGLQKIAHQNRLSLFVENYGHWGFPSEFLLYGSQSDQVGGEFWETGNPLNNIELRAAASCAHIYGKKSVYAEAFTSRRNFKQSPSTMKRWCDWAYAAGINHFIFNVYIHQPDERKPGIIMWFGTAFNRHNTWFNQSKAFIDYTRRSSVLLKAGLPVADVAYYIGENPPCMEGPQEPELPDGFDFDYINSDILINRTNVVNGEIVVKDGPSYKVLVLPKQMVMRPEVAEAIKRLVHNGAIVIGTKPKFSPSLMDYPNCDRKLKQIADEVWGKENNLKVHNYGKGRIYIDTTLDVVFKQINIAPDIKIVEPVGVRFSAAGAGKVGINDEGGIIFKHRTLKDCNIYFLSNTTDSLVKFTASIRGKSQIPTLWNAVIGKIIGQIAFKEQDKRTLIPLNLEPSESTFIVLQSNNDETDLVSKDLSESKTDTVLSLINNWVVHFKGKDIPQKVFFKKLTDWTKNSNPEIQYYSGTAIYKQNFKLNETDKNNQYLLDLGNVNVIATVFLNGKEVGTVWTTPWKINITDFIKIGNNKLTIEVTNTWNNRLVADSKLPIKYRKSYVSQPYRFNEENPLMPSGLLGPVTILKNAPLIKQATHNNAVFNDGKGKGNGL